MLEIRSSVDADVAAIAAIYGRAVATGLASFEIDPPDVAEMVRRRASILASGYPYLVAEDGGEVLGYAYASAYRTRPAYRFVVENSVYVAESARGRGIAKQLIECLVGATAALGFRQMIAVIGDSGNTASIRLHAACGFQEVGRLPSIGYKFGRWVDSVLMQRPLGDGDATLIPEAVAPELNRRAVLAGLLTVAAAGLGSIAAPGVARASAASWNGTWGDVQGEMELLIAGTEPNRLVLGGADVANLKGGPGTAAGTYELRWKDGSATLSRTNDTTADAAVTTAGGKTATIRLRRK